MQLPPLCAAAFLVLTLPLPGAVAVERGQPNRLRDEASPQARRLVSRGPGSTHDKFIVEVKPGFRTSTLIRPNGTATFPREPSAYQGFNCSDLFSGFVVEARAASAEALRGVDGVVNAWPLRKVPLPLTVRRPTVMSASRGPGAANASVHRWTGVDKLHAAGLTGKGVKIAIVDTGIDYTHKALGGCFGPGCRVMGGYDFVGSQDALIGPLEPDGDPIDRGGHGTHVAGIAAGNTDGFLGVAPEASLLAYKVFGDVRTLPRSAFWTDETDAEQTEGEVTEDILVQSFCDAYGAGADVISASIGMLDGFSDGPWSSVASRIVDKGVVVTIAAGNFGSAGPFSLGMGSNRAGVLSVAALNISEDGEGEQARLTPAQFTSWGPTSELTLKPDIGAPGVDIMSAGLNQNFIVANGTSMAAPYIAGIAALFIGKHGGRETHGSGFAHRLAKRIIASGRSVNWPGRDNATAPPVQVGTGLVDAEKVLEYTTELSFEAFALRDEKHFQPKWVVGIINRGDTEVEYRFETEPQSAVEMFDGRGGIKELSQIEPTRIRPVIDLPEPEVVSPGKEKSVVLEFSPPLGANKDLMPLYGGKIWIKGNNGEELCIPYTGSAYDTAKAIGTMFQRLGGVVTNKTFEISTLFGQDVMVIKASLTYPCTHLRWDIFERNWTERDWVYPPRVDKAGYIGSVAATSGADWKKVKGFPLDRVGRGRFGYVWFGEFADGRNIGPGEYTVRFAALKPHGNPRSSDDWDVLPTDNSSLVIGNPLLGERWRLRTGDAVQGPARDGHG